MKIEANIDHVNVKETQKQKPSKVRNKQNSKHSVSIPLKNAVYELERSVQKAMSHLDPSKRRHQHLKSLLNLISRLPHSPDGQLLPGSDARLLAQVFKAFRKDVPMTDILRSELKFLERVLDDDLLKKNDEERSVYLYSDHEAESGLLNFKRVYPESQSEGDSESSSFLEMEMELNSLGKVKVRLKRDAVTNSCLIFCDKKRFLIKSKLKILKKRLLKRKLNPGLIKVVPWSPQGVTKNKEKTRGLNLWG